MFKVVLHFEVRLPMGGQDTAYYYHNGSGKRLVMRWINDPPYEWDTDISIPISHIIRA